VLIFVANMDDYGKCAFVK